MSMILSPTKTDPPLKVVPAELAPIRVRPRAASDTAEPDGIILTEQDPQADIEPVLRDCLDSIVQMIEDHYEQRGLAEVRAIDAEFSADPPDACPALVDLPPVNYTWTIQPLPADLSPLDAIAYDTVVRVAVAVKRSYERLGLAVERDMERPSDVPFEDPGLVWANYDIPAMPCKSTKRPDASLVPANAPVTPTEPTSPAPHSTLGMRLRSGSVKPAEPASKRVRLTEPAPKTARMARGPSGVTTEHFPFLIVDDRRDEPKRGRCYHVRFLDGTDEWIPRRLLVEDGQEGPCDWVDWWYDDDHQETQPYICFMKGLPEYRDYMTASEGGNCVVQAINALYKIAGHPPLISQENWEDFCSFMDILPEDGIGIAKTTGLLCWMQANADCPNVSIQRSLLNENLFRGMGKGVASIFESKLPPGLYLVQCDLSEMLSHGMALQVKGTRRSHQVYDDGKWLGLMEAEEWLYRVRGIYRIEFTAEEQPPLEPVRKNKRKAKTRRSHAYKKRKNTSP